MDLFSAVAGRVSMRIPRILSADRRDAAAEVDVRAPVLMIN